MVLLEQAWALEPALRLTERAALLDRLQDMVDTGSAGPAPAGRHWGHELTAERAIDAARGNRLTEAFTLADEIDDDVSAIASARAADARGRALAWTGTDAATRRADRVLRDAAERYRQLGALQWAGYVSFWRGNAVCFQNGDLDRADQLMREALELLGTDSPWYATVLTFHADVLMSRGDWVETERSLTLAAELAERDDDDKTRCYVAWSRARVASVRGDAMSTERHVREAERGRGDWFEMNTGVTFLADAAEMLDRAGLPDQATVYLNRALGRDSQDEFVRQARAALLARRGEPRAAIEALHELARGDWLEKRLLWRHSLLVAWATFRAGREDAGPLAVRAFEQAAASGGAGIALTGEPDIATALLPLAEAAGSDHARRLMLGDRRFVVRLFGRTRIARADGTTVDMPAGRPAELVRLLAVNPHGVSVEQVAEWFFPDVPLTAARHRLRQVLTRLRANAGDLVTRDEDRLLLHPAWVDVREYLAAADRVGSATHAQAPQRAYAALALWTGEPLPADTYAPWAHTTLEQLNVQHLSLLDLITADAADHGSHQEAATALTAALVQAPHERERYYELAEHLGQLGRHAAARYLARLAGIDLDADE